MITLYLDMDGVLCNFNKAFQSYKCEHDEDHNKFRHAVLEGKIFENLELMPGALLLLEQAEMMNSWGYIDVQILTSMGTFDRQRGDAAKNQKLLWLEKHNITYRPNFVRTKTEKRMYAHKFAILIDDSIGCITPFREFGGIGILHDTVHKTLWELNNSITNLIDLGAKCRNE